MIVVSIIMPVYNRATLLPKTLLSISNQSYLNWELLVIDDGSSDNSIDIINDFSLLHPGKVIILYSKISRSGPSICRNIGINAANGEFLIFLDSDDLLEPFCLSQRVSLMNENIFTKWAIFNQYSWNPHLLPPYSIFNKNVATVTESIKYFLMLQAPWQLTAVIWRLSFLKSLGGFDEDLIYMEDPDLHIRALFLSEFPPLFFYDYPPDSFYRLDSMDQEKSTVFYDYSIIYRFKYLEKNVICNDSFIMSILPHLNSVRDGFILFFKSFIISRISIYHIATKDMILKLRKKNILSKLDLWKLNFYILIFRSENRYIKIFRLKGLIYRLFI